MAKAAAKKPVAKNASPKKAAPKKAVKKTTSGKEAKPIKYADKSAGQPQLTPIFNKLVKLMEPFAKGSVEKKGGKDGQVGLISFEPVEINGKKTEEVYLAGGLVQKGYVGFYFMPVYTYPELKSELHPELLKCLKGKSCFHIKKLDEEMAEQVKEALEKGYALYKKKGWIS
jgi:hypothetical protein